ncbi:branched-chain amino acid ABC transporter permease [Rhodopila globiformis]|uniref:ABC transporter permease n=1 Tax=Rhodopila globiformis TaxID=1071 RepID=A0A2S6NGZ6_RHOGL|nr:branched-chain amino acid ABC transporter permease [Rhodopila globiformis]PPQ33877.1 ABC transporter permease [Rhodopila globiformis]
MLHLLNGPQTLGNGRGFWISAGFVLAAALIYPAFADPYDVGNFAYFLIWVFMALGLCLMWGYGGMLSFGQTFFFGIGGYAYGVFSVDLGNAYGMALGDFAMAVLLAGLAAAILGYLMIYGRIGGVFFGIVTLSVTLALAFFLGQTAGPEWAIGEARLNGFNGMQGMSPLSIPWFGGGIDLEETALYYFVLILLVCTYLALRVLVNSRVGNVLVAVREDPQRTELLGYDVRRFQFGAFVLGSMLAAVSGVLYTSWGQFITPSSIGLPAAAMPIVWVAFSGRSDLTAVLVGTFVLLAVFQTLTIYSEQAALILMGLILVVTVMVAPQGCFVGLSRIANRLPKRNRTLRVPSAEPG